MEALRVYIHIESQSCAISNTTGSEKGTGDTTNLRYCASDVAFTKVLVVDISFASSVIHKQDNRVYADMTT